MKPLALALLSLSLAACPAHGQVKIGNVQPDRLVFGKVHTGAVVEGSFLVYAAPGVAKQAKFEVTAPPFVKILHKDTDDKDTRVLRGTVEFALDTTRAGEFSGAFAVTLNGTSVRVPVSASVKPRRAGLLRLLVVPTPFQCFSTNDGGHFKQWTDLVAAAPWDVHYLLTYRDKKPVLRDLSLADFGAVLLGPEGVFWMQPVDLKRLRAYVEEGGCVLVMANYFFRGTVEKANTLLTHYGIEMADTEALIGGGADVTIEKDALDAQVVKAGIEKVTFFRASPITATNPRLAKVLVKSAHIGRSGDGFVASANAGNGKIYAIGQSLWWDWVSRRRDPHGGNAKLLGWVLTSAHQRHQRFLDIKQPLSAEQLATCWDRLASDDVDEASEARYWLTRAPGADRQTVSFLKDHLRPDPPPDAERLKRLLAQLDDESFQTREKAQRELDAMGDLATALLKKTLEGKPSPEVRRRIEAILGKSEQPSRSKRQSLRAIEILEQLATPQAQDLLRNLGQGAPGTQVTLAAQAALERLASESRPRTQSETKPDKRR
jgi:hypothetical protein